MLHMPSDFYALIVGLSFYSYLFSWFFLHLLQIALSSANANIVTVRILEWPIPLLSLLFIWNLPYFSSYCSIRCPFNLGLVRFNIGKITTISQLLRIVPLCQALLNNCISQFLLYFLEPFLAKLSRVIQLYCFIWFDFWLHLFYFIDIFCSSSWFFWIFVSYLLNLLSI